MDNFRTLLLLAAVSSLALACGVEKEADTSDELAALEFEPCLAVGDREGCDGGFHYCGIAELPVDPEEQLEWSLCVDPELAACIPHPDNSDCRLSDGEPVLIDHSSDDDGTSDDQGGSTPLVLVFDDVPVTYEAVPASASTFDIDTTGVCLSPAWPTANTPWLAFDRDRSGSIEAGDELFGSGSRLASGERATQGFAALAELDSDGDGRITSADSGFADLVLWGDHDADRRSTPWEMTSLKSAGVIAIELTFNADNPLCDGRGNCEVERAAFEFSDRYGVVRRGEVVDVHVSCED